MRPGSPAGPGSPVRTAAAASAGPNGGPGRPAPIQAGVVPPPAAASDRGSPSGIVPVAGAGTSTADRFNENPPWAVANGAAPPTQVQDRPAPSAPATRGGRAAAAAATTETGAGSRQQKSARRAGRRKRRGRLYIAVGVLAVVAAGGAAYEVLLPSGSSGPAHTITTPDRIGGYTQATALGTSLKIADLRNSIVHASRGEANHVVDNVYQDGSQIVLFIGGNLTGSSAASFISSFIGSSPDAVSTSAGSLGGSAACLPSVSGHPAECAWADDDTFGVVLSPTLSATELAGELRVMRPQLEHLAK